MGLVKNANHFTVCIDKFLNLISNCKVLDTDLLYYNEIVNRMERTYIFVHTSSVA